MQARWLMGHTRERAPNWKVTGGPRPAGAVVLHPMDALAFEREIAALGAKRVLEFGPGASTDVFLKLGMHVTTIEHSEKWFEAAKERFKDNPNVRVLKGEDEMPFLCPELGDEQFDLAFVDAPQGYFPARKVHEGYEDCSRFNTVMFALQHAPVVLLHDAMRPLERVTLSRVRKMGHTVERIQSPFGMVRITHNGNKDRPDAQGTEKSGGTPTRSVTGRGHGRSRKRSRRRDAGGTGSS